MAINKELLKGSLKTIVLQLLLNRDMHGYELLSTLKEKTNSRLEVTEGTLYPLLHSLEEDGCLVSKWQKGSGKRKIKVYEITPDGKKLLKKRSQELFDFMSVLKDLVTVKFEIL